MYSSEDADTVEANVDVLPIVVHALGVGATRYLKVSMNTLRPSSKVDQCQALIPQLTHPLHPVPYKKPHIALQLSSLRALGTVMQECAPRIQYWKGTIVEGVAKCWVALWDAKKADEGMYAFCCCGCSNADLMNDSRVRETERCTERCLCRVIRGGTVCARCKSSGFSSVFNPLKAHRSMSGFSDWIKAYSRDSLAICHLWKIRVCRQRSTLLGKTPMVYSQSQPRLTFVDKLVVEAHFHDRQKHEVGVDCACLWLL